jgi:hypothetical protein
VGAGVSRWSGMQTVRLSLEILNRVGWNNVYVSSILKSLWVEQLKLKRENSAKTEEGRERLAFAPSCLLDTGD